MTADAVRLGMRANWAQFRLLVVVNAFVGAMVGMERSILPAIAEHEFLLAARAAILSFIVVFGVTKALTNYLAGRLSDAYGRKIVLLGVASAIVLVAIVTFLSGLVAAIRMNEPMQVAPRTVAVVERGTG